MAFNFSSLQQKQDQLIYTIDEIIEWNRKIAFQEGYAEAQYYDKDGNLRTKKVPTIPQLIEQFSQGINSQMHKSLYVDQINGDDENGDGSPNAPFKTIKKAIDSVPTGGRGDIYVKGTNTVDEYVGIESKFIRFFSADDTSKIVLNRTASLSTNPLFVRDSTVIFRINVELQNTQDANARIVIKADGSSTHIAFNNLSSGKKSSLILGDNTSINTSLGASIYIAHTDITFGNNSYLVDIYHAAIVTIEKSSVTVGGNAITDSDIINHARNIIKDSNGIPRNIISNILL
jgi:hypothetical protein